MKAQLRAWNVGILVAALVMSCANSRGVKLPRASTPAVGNDGGSPPAQRSSSGTQGAAGAGASTDVGMQSIPVSNVAAGMQNGPLPSGDVGMQSDPESSVDAGMENGPDASPAGSLMLTFTTATSGLYAPRNAGAAWIETSSGVFVKTLEHWAGIDGNRLVRWIMASGGWGNLFTMPAHPGDMMDAISRATLHKHETHELTWNLKDADGAVVPDGPYRVVIEVVDSNDGSVTSEVAFEKGREPLTVMPPDTPPFVGFTLVYQP